MLYLKRRRTAYGYSIGIQALIRNDSVTLILIEYPYEGSAFLKLNQHFLSHDVDGQTVIVPTAGAEFHGLIQCNKTLSAIAECLKNDITENEIVDTLCNRFDGDREDIAADVHEAIGRLRKIGAIDE